MDENKQNGAAKPTIDKEYLKKLAEKIKAEKARKESLSHKNDSTPTSPSISSISSKYLAEDDEEEMASEKTAIIDLSAFSGHASDARLTIVDGKDAGKNIEITKDEILAGRSLDNDFVISDISVSRKHFKIVKENNRFIVYDLGSGNGIKVNGSKVTSADLSDGDIISVGARQIKFEILNPELKQTQQRAKKQTMQVDYQDDNDELTPKKSSSLVWIIIALLIVAGGIVAYFIFSGSSQPQQQTSFVFGEKEKLAIERMIDKKDLQNAEKAILDANVKTPGDNPYKLWLSEQLVLIGKEKTNQITFNNAKNVIQKNPEEAEKLLKSIPDSSIFSEEAKNLLTLIPAKKEAPKAEPKKEEVKEEPKKEEPKAEPKKEEVKAEPKKAEPKKAEKKAEPKQEEPKKAEKKAAEPKKEEPKAEPKKEEVKEEPKAEPQKAEPKKEEVKAEPKKEEPKAEPKKAEKKETKKKKAPAMSEEEAKKLYMEANAMKDDDPEAAREILQRILNSVDPESKRYKKAKELLEKL